jgi:dihydrofolate reductase
VRKFKLQVQPTVDGFMGGPNGEMDWTTVPWSTDAEAYADALSESVETIVLGRKLAEGFIPAWASGPEGESRGVPRSRDQPATPPRDRSAVRVRDHRAAVRTEARLSTSVGAG